MINTLKTVFLIAISHPILTILAGVLIVHLFKKIISKISDAADEIDRLKNQNKVPDSTATNRMRSIIESEYRCPGCGSIYGKLFDKKSNGPYSHRFGYRCMNCNCTWEGNLYNWNFEPTKKWRLKNLDRSEAALTGEVQDILLDEDSGWTKEIPESCIKPNDGCFYKENDGYVLFKELKSNGDRISDRIRLERIRESGPVEYFYTKDGYHIYIDKDGEYRYASDGLYLNDSEVSKYLDSGYLYYSNTPAFARQQQEEEEERQRREREREEEEERENDWLWW